MYSANTYSACTKCKTVYNALVIFKYTIFSGETSSRLPDICNLSQYNAGTKTTSVEVHAQSRMKQILYGNHLMS